MTLDPWRLHFALISCSSFCLIFFYEKECKHDVLSTNGLLELGAFFEAVIISMYLLNTCQVDYGAIMGLIYFWEN